VLSKCPFSHSCWHLVNSKQTTSTSLTMGAGTKLRKFQADKDLELFAVSPADAAAEAVSNRDNQVYFGKGAISLQEGEHIETLPNHPHKQYNLHPCQDRHFMLRHSPNSMQHACVPSLYVHLPHRHDSHKMSLQEMWCWTAARTWVHLPAWQHQW
jgi:hypothetical protein